jgi:hypothetical protein
MCEDHAAGSPPGLTPSGRAASGAPASGPTGSGPTPSGLTRRGLIAAGAATAAAALAGPLGRLPLLPPVRPVAADGMTAYSMAMHVHSSFSEEAGSMDSQLFQATANGVDVLWWTDHDARMDGIGYRDVVHFTSLDDEAPGPGQGHPWHWQVVRQGPLTSASGGGIVAQPCSPNDPVHGGSLALAAESASQRGASQHGASKNSARFGYYADCGTARLNYRDNLTGQTLRIDVQLADGWRSGYLELLINSSYHEAVGARPAGEYSLSYRFVPAGTPAGRSADGLQAVVTIPVEPPVRGGWATISMTPAEDIAALWPDLDHRDFALYELTLSAVSDGELVRGHFDYLRFDRKVSGEAAFAQQAEMAAALARRYPQVTQIQALEVSLTVPHVNWFGGGVGIPSYGDTTPAGYPEYLRDTLIPRVHAAGGLVSYNHPYGYGWGHALPAATQDEMLATVARDLLPAGRAPAALGADLIEVGYPLRAGVDLAHHVALWDTLSRNGVFLTGNGTNDDHTGQDWRDKPNNWYTSAWSTSVRTADLLAALAAGRAWCGALTYRGSLDLVADGTCPMGSVSVAGAGSRRLAVSATGIPAGGSLQVVQGVVDYAGAADPTASARVIGSYPAGRAELGPVGKTVDTSESSFVRAQVVDASGAIVALSNPVWLLRKAPPGGVPAARAA